MKSMATAKMLALPMLLVATVTFAQTSAPDAKQAGSDAKASAQETAAKSGNAIKDSWITLKVHSQFVPEDALKDSDIDVDTANGVVTLTGTVASAAGRARAVAIAKATDGVKSVNDRLRIAPESMADAREAGRKAGEETKEAGRTAAGAAKDATGTTGRAMSDGWIKSKIAAQIVTEDALDNSDIDVDVKHGVVSLEGAVRTAAAKDRAAAIAKATDGVTSVKNNLKVSAADKMDK
jgi:hyperosmotically inducible protein